ncbi:tetratricopeptide repeat protein [Arenibaculum pallidiluteum]|uniref:tetratricopeptide repeat protein n=1 Tax=Arenibaculum pallidiluteum TaxID=2812559 RepID=UPI001A96CBB2|nr:tetratricopeptide repeat protein [Arenibaculum pallidiluteum]
MVGEILSRAVAHHSRGELDEAAALYLRAAALAPGLAAPHYLLAEIALARGDAAAAAGRAMQALLRDPGDADSLLALGRGLALQGTSGAASALRRAALCDPADARPWTHLGALLQDRGDIEACLAAYAEAARLAPGPDALCNLGGALRQAGRTEEALATLQQGLALDRRHAGLWFNLGNALETGARLPAAVEAYRNALALDPSLQPAWVNLGTALRELRRADDAAAALRHALALAPADGLAWTGWGNAEFERGRPEQARSGFARACRITPAPALLLKKALSLPVIPESLAEIAGARERLAACIEDLSRTGARLRDPVQEVGQTAFYLAYHARDDRLLQERLAAFYLEACPELAFEAAHCRGWTPPLGRRLRLGMVSQNLHAHTIAKLNHGLLETIDRGAFETVLFLPRRPPDPWRDRVTAAADRVVDLPADLGRAREAVAAAELDILYFPDIGMSVLTYFMAFARLAPVQCVGWGHPDTTGIPNLDWFASCAAMEPPGAQAHYSERLALLPGTTVRYERPPPPRPRARAHFGLDDAAHLYLCPQSLFKVHPDFDAVLAEILGRDPDGVLAFVNTQGAEVAERLARRLSRAAGRDLRPRLRMFGGLSTDDFRALMELSDAMLDPLHYSGGNTTLEAFAGGVPVVTWPGTFMRGRHTAGFYALMGWTDLVAADWPGYVDHALALGRGSRGDAVAAIRARSPALFDDVAAIRGFETFLRDAVATAGAPAGGHP